MLLTIRNIALNNSENAIDGQSNFLLNFLSLQCSLCLTHRIIIRELSWTIGNIIHIRLDKSLDRQLQAVLSAFQRIKAANPSTKKPSLPEKANSHGKKSSQRQYLAGQEKEDRKAALTKKLVSYIHLLPEVLTISLPRLEVEFVNADKSSSAMPSSINVKIGCSLKCTTSFYDVFSTTPKGLTMSVELSSLESSFIQCGGMMVSVGVTLKETGKLDSVSLIYRHQKTECVLRPSFA